MIGKKSSAFLVISFFVLISNEVFAQKGLYFTVFGATQRTFIYNKLEKNHTDLSKIYKDGSAGEIMKYPSYTVSPGFLLRYQVGKKILLGYGFEYGSIHQRYRIFSFINDQYIDGRIRLSYLNIPLIFQFNYHTKKKFLLFVSGGPELSMLISTKGAVPVYTAIYNYFDLNETGGVYRGFVLNGFLATGAEIKIKEKFSLFCQARAGYSFTDVENKHYYRPAEDNRKSYTIFYDANVTRPATHNILIGICSGITFRIK